MKNLGSRFLGGLTAILLCLCSSSGVSAQQEDTLRVGLASLPPGNGNPFTSSARTAWYTFRTNFDTLTQLGAKLSVEPMLAVSWKNEDDHTWVFTLREDMTFSNGEPLDADAVVFTYTYLMSADATRESQARDVDNVAGVRALDPLTVEFTTRLPDPMFPRQVMTIPVIPPAYWQAEGRDAFNFRPVGSGPFIVESWEPTKVTYRAFENSWRPPQVARLELLELPEPATRVAALLTGQIDIASELGPDDIPNIEAAGLLTYNRPATSVRVISFNTTVPSPLQDRRVRLALNHAVNREAIAQVIMGGLVEPAGQLTPMNNPEANPNIEPYAYDPEKAKALLAEAGYPDGFDFVFEFSAGTGGIHIATMYQQVAADLARIGVNMEIRPLPWTQYVKGVRLGEWSGQAFSFEYETLPTGQTMRPFRLHSCEWPHPWYCDESIMPVIETARRSFDPAEHLAAVHEVLRHYHDDAAALPTIEPLGIDGLSPKVTGYHQDGGIIPWHAIGING